MRIQPQSSKALLLLVVLASIAAAPATQPIDIGSRVQMFIDSHLIERAENVELRLNHPQRAEIVLTLDKPWEGPTSAYYSVFRDGEIVRLYYRGGTDQYTCYAESKDGIHFMRPDLGIVEFEGSKQNNIIFHGIESSALAPFRDENPNAKPEQRYKALGYRPSRNGGALIAFASPDAIHWTKIQDEPVTTRGQFDSLNTVSWDKFERRYRCFSRYWDEGAFKGVRAIQSATSDDFLHWSEPTPNVYAADAPREHFYTNAAIRCPGAEHVWISFPKRFEPERKKIAEHQYPGVSDAVFMSSSDAVHWDRTFTDAWLRPGLDERNWTDRCNMPAWGIIETQPAEFSMYASEHYEWPDNRLRRLVIPRHRFASVHATRHGEFVTPPLKFAGDKLNLNYSTSAAGSVQVELQDEQGQPLAGFALADTQPIYGDELDRAVEWRGGSLSNIKQPIRIRFVLNDADLFAIRTNSP
jgi:hypothetical protein